MPGAARRGHSRNKLHLACVRVEDGDAADGAPSPSAQLDAEASARDWIGGSRFEWAEHTDDPATKGADRIPANPIAGGRAND